MSGHDSRTPTEQRSAWNAKLHIAKKDLGWDDDQYRDFLERVTTELGSDYGPPVRSASDLNMSQWKAVRGELKRLGWTATYSRAKRRTTPARSRDELIGKITAQLAAADRTESYADAVAKRMFKVDRYEWLNTQQLTKLIAALGYDAARHGRDI